MRKPSSSPACPCGQGGLENCCGPFLCGAAHAPTPQALMRSRYCAYVLHHRDYLLSTWHPSTRPQPDTLSLDPGVRWLGLEIRNEEILDDAHARVEFVARYREGSRGHRMHEISSFVREEGRWLYTSGITPEPSERSRFATPTLPAHR